jgi:uncharacterized protein YjiS (DUF1127 family)
MTSIFSRIFQRSKQRKALTDLLQLDDHLLRDIGISRDDLQQSLRGRKGRLWMHE